MGRETARITAQDFVTPPEFAGLSLANEGSGRIGGVRLGLSATGLCDRYQQVPLRVLPLDFGPAQPDLIYLLNPTAGLFDGDAQLVEVHAQAGTRAFVTGQSATRVHPCLHAFGTQQWRIRVEPDAILVMLPGPTIPFAGCQYFQRAAIDLAVGAQFIWGDIWLSGRYSRGDQSERFRFRTIVQDMTVRREGRLVYRDRFRWDGPWDDESAAWHFGGADCCGSLYSTVPVPEVLTSVDPKDSDLRRATLATATNDTVLRWSGPVEAVTAAVTRAALTLAAHAENKQGAWLLDSNNLAPNHWFTQPRAGYLTNFS